MQEAISGGPGVSETHGLTLEEIAAQDAARARQHVYQQQHNRQRRGTSNGRAWGYTTLSAGKRQRRRK